MSPTRNSVPVLPAQTDSERPDALQGTPLLDAAPDPMFDNLSALAAKVFAAPLVLISLLDEHSHILKSSVDTIPHDTSRHVSLCANALSSSTPLIVLDTRQDERFRDHPLVTGDPWICFFAGMSLTDREGHKLGTFCVLDPHSRSDFSTAQCRDLERFASLTSNLIEQRLLERELRDANERFVLATRASSDGIFDLDFLSGELHCSARWNRILGLPEDDTQGRLQDWTDRIHPYDYDRVVDRWKSLQHSGENSAELEFRCRHENGSWLWLITRAFCQRADNGALLRVTGSCADITAARSVDPLTGLHNRTSLLQHLQWRIDRHSEDDHGYGLLFVDLDAFKRINDSLGHRRGDAVLVEVARRLEKTMQDSSGSVVSRLGGDEFVILVDNVASADDVLAYATRLKELLSAEIDCDGQQVFVSASVGAVFGGRSYTRAEQMLEDADLAMYRAKVRGKAQNAMFSEDMREEARARLQLENDLRKAMENEELEVWYQPKVRLSSGYIKGFEALVRWRHPGLGLVPPAQFIPVAEEIGLISEIGRWVAHQAIAQLAEWRAKGLVSISATMAVNVSPRQFKDPELLRFLEAQLRPFGMPATCFVVEVTESVLVEDSAASLALLESIVAAGIGLELDDFGTGYSSLSYLHRFPFRSVKIDRSFIGRMSTDPESVALVASIVALAGSLKMSIIAEGVENEAQAKYLRDMGCNSAQGYLFAPPRPAEEVERYLRERTNPLGANGSTELHASAATSSRPGLWPEEPRRPGRIRNPVRPAKT